MKIKPRRMPRAQALMGAFMFWAAAGAALAQQDQVCAPTPQGMAAATPEQLRSILPQELGKLSECQQDSAWLGWVGWALNQNGRYTEAVDYLERSLMLEPGPLHVQMDYAIALAGSGDGMASIQLMQSLLQEPQLPAPLRETLSREVARWSAPEEPQGWRHRGYVAAKLGHDTNLLGMPDLSSLTLTIQGLNVQMPLDASYARQPGNYARTDLGWTGRKGPWQLSASLGVREGLRSRAGLQQAQGLAEYSMPSHYMGGNLAVFNSEAGTRFRTAGLGGGVQWGLTNCFVRTGLELQERRLQDNRILSGRYAGGLVQHTCEARASSDWLLGMQFWQASLRVGQDVPEQAERAGGRQQQNLLRLVAVGQGWRARDQWLVDGEIYLQSDTSGYSPLLQNAARRRISRQALRAEYSFPLATSGVQGWQLALGLEWQRQRANLVLFQQRSQGAYMALRTQW
ncbi:MAG: hypothetical protein ABWY08_04905 [Comamonas sp.]